MHLKMSSGKWRPYCIGLNVLKVTSKYVTPFDGVKIRITYGLKTLIEKTALPTNFITFQFLFQCLDTRIVYINQLG